MGTLLSSGDIFETELMEVDVIEGLKYALISRGDTYDRMGSQKAGQLGVSIFRIASGRAVEEALRRSLIESGVELQRDQTYFTQTDEWDLRTVKGVRLDVKGATVYTDFPNAERPPLEAGSVDIQCAGNPWSRFFPVLIPRDQFDRRLKEIYVYYLLGVRQPSNVIWSKNKVQLLIALPQSGDATRNAQYNRILSGSDIKRRVARRQPFSMEISASMDSPFDLSRVSIGYRTASGGAAAETLELAQGETQQVTGLTGLHYLRALNPWTMTLKRGEDPILFEVLFKGVDREPDFDWQVRARDLYDLWIEENKVLFIGWITAEEFESARQRYPTLTGDSQQWRNLLTPSREAGIARSGVFCYVYPPMPTSTSLYKGGTRNVNYYCLPKDLHPMGELAGYLSGR